MVFGLHRLVSGCSGVSKAWCDRRSGIGRCLRRFYETLVDCDVRVGSVSGDMGRAIAS